MTLLRRHQLLQPHAAAVSARAGLTVDELATTRQNVVDYIGTVDLGYDGLMSNWTSWANAKYGDILNPPAGTAIDWGRVSPERRAAFLADYKQFLEWRDTFSSWKTFSQGYTKADWWDRWTTGTAAAKAQVDSYRALLVQWRERAVKLGVPVTSPLPDRPSTGSSIPWATLGLVVVGGVVLYALVSRSSGGTAAVAMPAGERILDRDELLAGREHYRPA